MNEATEELVEKVRANKKKEKTVYLEQLEYEDFILTMHSLSIEREKQRVQYIDIELGKLTDKIVKNKEDKELKQKLEFYTKKKEEVEAGLEKLENMEEKEFIKTLSKNKQKLLKRKIKREPSDNDRIAKMKRIMKRRNKKGYKYAQA